jgi:hypothetical protein
MRKKRKLLICAACALLALLALLAYTSTTTEPSYNGHSLNYWVPLLSVTPAPVFGSALPDAEHDKAISAISDIGAASVPFLVKWIQFEPPSSKHAAFGYWLSRTHFPFGQNIYDLVTRRRAARLADGTVSAFGILGTRATPALDELCRLMNQTNATFTCRRALAALSFLGPNALPPLLAVVTNEYSGLRVEALDYIAAMPNLGDAAELAVPPLAQCLSETNNPLVQENAAYALGRLRAAPQTSVHALMVCLSSTDRILRANSARALSKFGPEAASAIPALTNALRDSNHEVRAWAAHALHQIDPVTFPPYFLH